MDEIDLVAKLRPELLRPVNRSTAPALGHPGAVEVDEAAAQGVVWVDGVEFGDGVLELEVRGRDVPGRSFVGVAFHGVNDSTYDAVYVRPFNFRSDEPQRRAHGIQYISHPEHTWRALRDAHPGRYEAELVPAPHPAEWLRLRVSVDYPELLVYVGDAAEPVLRVDQLGPGGKGRVGLWVGNDSDGAFRNLRIAPDP